MTCTKDCKDCAYAEIVPVKARCLKNNVTCSGNCRECQFYEIMTYKIKCSADSVDVEMVTNWRLLGDI